MFKKTSAFLLALMLVLTLMPFAPNVMAAEKPITVMLLGNKLSFDTEPVIINDRTMVPMRAVFEGLGMTVSWDDITRRVTATGGGKEIVLTVGSENALVNGEGVDLDSPAHNNRRQNACASQIYRRGFGTACFLEHFSGKKSYDYAAAFR